MFNVRRVALFKMLIVQSNFQITINSVTFHSRPDYTSQPSFMYSFLWPGSAKFFFYCFAEIPILRKKDYRNKKRNKNRNGSKTVVLCRKPFAALDKISRIYIRKSKFKKISRRFIFANGEFEFVRIYFSQIFSNFTNWECIS